MCGFNDLDREAKVARAHEIINSTELKQAICHQILGTTFKDVVNAMMAVINERQLTPDQKEEVELRETHPQKYERTFDPKIEFKVNKHAADPSRKKGSGYREYTREEVAKLIAASNAPFTPPEPVARKEYPTYSREQVEFFMRQHNEYIANEKKQKEERAKWDSPKTIELEPKIESTTKRSNSTNT